MVNGINGLGSSAFNKINNWNTTSTNFFHPPVADPSKIQVFGNGYKNAAKEGFRKVGYKLNAGTYNLANKAGNGLMNIMTKPGSQIGGFLSKVPGLGKVAEGLSKLGKAGGSKLPGLGTIFAIGTGIVGIFKAGGKALQGDWKGAGHQLLKSAGSVGGILAGAALCMTGVGIPAGIALAVGAGFAGDWLGKKAADTVFGPVDQNGNSKGYVQQQYVQQNNNDFYSQYGSNDQFDAQIRSILANNVY